MITWTPSRTPSGRHQVLEGYPLWIPTLVCDRCGKEYKYTGKNHRNLMARYQWSADSSNFEYGAYSLQTRLWGPDGPRTLTLDVCQDPCSVVLYDHLLEFGAKINEDRSSLEFARSDEGHKRARSVFVQGPKPGPSALPQYPRRRP
jgi:hypothetical protein